MSAGGWIFIAFLVVLVGILISAVYKKDKTTVSSGKATDFTKQGKLPEDEDPWS